MIAVLALAVRGAVEAYAHVATDPGYVARFDQAQAAGTLSLDAGYFYDAGAGYVPTDPGFVFTASFRDDTTPPCFDGCNGITSDHRPGWCRVNPEHADMDCIHMDAGNYEYDDFDVAEDVVVPSDPADWLTEEPF